MQSTASLTRVLAHARARVCACCRVPGGSCACPMPRDGVNAGENGVAPPWSCTSPPTCVSAPPSRTHHPGVFPQIQRQLKAKGNRLSDASRQVLSLPVAGARRLEREPRMPPPVASRCGMCSTGAHCFARALLFPCPARRLNHPSMTRTTWQASDALDALLKFRYLRPGIGMMAGGLAVMRVSSLCARAPGRTKRTRTCWRALTARS